MAADDAVTEDQTMGGNRVMTPKVHGTLVSLRRSLRMK